MSTAVSSTPKRRIYELVDFLDEGVEARLERRAEVYCKRWRLRQLSARFFTMSIQNRPAMLMRIVVEDLPADQGRPMRGGVQQ